MNSDWFTVDQAIAYAREGWAVLPLGRKLTPAVSGWGQGAEWSPDDDQFRAWRAEGKLQNLGILTGPRSGVWVLDVDNKPGTDRDGQRSLTAILDAAGEILPATLCATTKSHGVHYYFQWDDRLEGITISNDQLGAGLDVRGANGFAVLPPSAEGQYAWVDAGMEPARTPQWLVDLLHETHGQNRTSAGGPVGMSGDSITEILARGPVAGRRNQDLNRLAFMLAGSLGMPLDVVEGVCASWNALDPMDPADFRKTLGSALSAVERKRQETQGEDGEWPAERTGLGNAELFAKKTAGFIRYEADRGVWYAWDGSAGLWAEDKASGGVVRAWDAITAAWEVPEVSEDASKEEKAAVADLARWKARSRGKAGVAELTDLARSRTALMASLAEFDARPMELNTPGGIVDLLTGEVRGHHPDAMHTQQTACSIGDGKPGKWLEFLDAVLPDPEVRKWLQAYFGLSLSGASQQHQIFAFLKGEGGNGKGIITDTLLAVAGSYGLAPAPGFLKVRQHEKHASELADFRGKRLVVCDETGGGNFDEDKIKRLTGGGILTANRMRENNISFAPSWHLTVMGNDLPSLRLGGNSFGRRIRVIDFAHEVPQEFKTWAGTSSVSDTFVVREGPQILRWLAEGAREALSGRYNVTVELPEAVGQASDEYMRGEDLIGRFLDWGTERGIGTKVTQREAYDRFREWCEFHEGIPRHKILIAKEFRKGVLRHGFEAGKGAGNVAVYQDMILVRKPE